MSKSCRWGILGSAAIARKVWTAIRISSGGSVIAVASRDQSKAAEFVRSCSVEVPMQDADGHVVDVQAVGGYQALLDRKDIDAVYIPLPTGLRSSWVIAAAKAGKHVLCEKPAAIHADDLRAMINACNDAGVQFMDGVMFDHSLRLTEMMNDLRQPTIGQLRHIRTHFSFPSNEEFANQNIRASADLEPHGCLGDLGWYCIRQTLWATDFELPVAVQGQNMWPIGDGVPGEFTGQMKFASGMTASFFTSFRCGNQQTALFSGADGYLSLDDFVLPFASASTSYEVQSHQVDIDRCRWHCRNRSETRRFDEYASGESSAQEVRMIQRMNEIVTSKKTDSSLAKRSLHTQIVLDAMRKSDAAGGRWIDLP
jgi:predicted dehydrogenase